MSPRVLMLSPDLFSPQARRRPPPPCQLHPSKVTTELVPPSLRFPASLPLAEGGNTYDEHLPIYTSVVTTEGTRGWSQLNNFKLCSYEFLSSTIHISASPLISSPPSLTRVHARLPRRCAQSAALGALLSWTRAVVECRRAP